MELRSGYKQTEAGLIPEDWQTAQLGELLTRLANGALYQPSKATGLPVTRIETISGGAIDMSRVGYGVRTPELEKYRLQEGDILFSHINSVEHIGKVALYAGHPPLYHGINLLLLRAGEELDCQYLFFWLGSHEGRKKAVSLARQAVSQASINTTDLRRVEIAVPSVPEQRAIASALSDVDALLDGLDRLIAKKRDLKQAAMQQLLTGQTRLPGFDGEWEVRRLGELADMASGGTPLSSVQAFYGGGIPWVSIADMTRAGRVIATTEKTLTALGLERSAAQLFPEGTVLYAMYASLGECCIAGTPVTTSQAILGIRPRQRLVPAFLYYVLLSMKANVRTLGQHGTQANLNKGIVQDFQIALPSIDEQTAIAALLSDMDTELAALEARRDKTRALKQGMMQELLTGRTRLL